jgi:hypothetical protein
MQTSMGKEGLHLARCRIVASFIPSKADPLKRLRLRHTKVGLIYEQ